jgi:ectoine hydroxylase-related dioxygenase (phytanoyl-CoA dioxygenase family)
MMLENSSQDEGYRIARDVLAVDEMDRLRRALHSSAVRQTRAGARNLLGISEVASLAADERLVQIAAEFLGGRPRPFRATLFDKSAVRNWGVPWHQDRSLPVLERVDAPGWGPWSMKAGVQFAQAPAPALARIVALRVHIDDSTETNGPLRVLPGSHANGVLSAEEILALATRARAVDCTVPRGGVVAMRPLLVHSSRKAENRRPRCVVHIEYARSLKLDAGLRLAVA